MKLSNLFGMILSPLVNKYCCNVLQALDNGHFLMKDDYIYHVITDKNDILMVTSHRLLLASLISLKVNY